MKTYVINIFKKGGKYTWENNIFKNVRAICSKMRRNVAKKAGRCFKRWENLLSTVSMLALFLKDGNIILVTLRENFTRVREQFSVFIMGTDVHNYIYLKSLQSMRVWLTQFTSQKSSKYESMTNTIIYISKVFIVWEYD